MGGHCCRAWQEYGVSNLNVMILMISTFRYVAKISVNTLVILQKCNQILIVSQVKTETHVQTSHNHQRQPLHDEVIHLLVRWCDVLQRCGSSVTSASSNYGRLTKFFTHKTQTCMLGASLFFRFRTWELVRHSNTAYCVCHTGGRHGAFILCTCARTFVNAFDSSSLIKTSNASRLVVFLMFFVSYSNALRMHICFICACRTKAGCWPAYLWTFSIH